MKIDLTSEIYSIEIEQNKRYLCYGYNGYSYWYNDKEVSNKQYENPNKWKQLLNRFNNGNRVLITKGKK